MNDLNEVFNIEQSEKSKEIAPITEVTGPVSVHSPKVEVDPIDNTLIPDFITAKDNIDAIMDMGRIALEKVLQIAQEGQHPRFYEAAAILIKNLSDANKDYMDGQLKYHQMKKIRAELGHETQSGAKINIQQAVFQGTSTELLQQINPRKVKIIDAESSNT